VAAVVQLYDLARQVGLQRAIVIGQVGEHVWTCRPGRSFHHVPAQEQGTACLYQVELRQAAWGAGYTFRVASLTANTVSPMR
jgi:hypothetical protein